MDNLIRTSKAYWIWGLFPINETIFLNSLQYKVQEVLKSPRFEAHITLSGPFLEIDKTLIKKLKNYSKYKSSVSIEVIGYDYKMEKYESFFIALKNSLNLNNLRSEVNKLTKPKFNKKYTPHISLSYGNHNKKDKEVLIATMPRLKKDFAISRLALVKVDENINLWNIKDTFDFKN